MLRWKDKTLDHPDTKKLIRNFGTYSILLLALIAMTFFGVCSPRGGGVMSVSGHAAKVAGEEINTFEFRRAYQNRLESFKSQFGGQFDPSMFNLSKMVLDQLVTDRIIFVTAKESGIEVQPVEVERLLLDGKAFRDDKNQFSLEAYTNYLKSQGYTEASFTDEIRRSITVQKFREYVNSTAYISTKAQAWEKLVDDTKFEFSYVKFDAKNTNIVISPAEVQAFLNDAGKARVKEYYESNKTQYEEEEKVRARHILVQYVGARNASGESAKRTKDDALKRAQNILKLANSKSDFATLAQQWTDEPSGKTKGGDLGYFDKKTMDPKFTEVAFKLPKDSLSEIVETPFGFHIIKVEDKKAGKNTTLDQATKSIAETFIKKDKAPAALKSQAEEFLKLVRENKTPLTTDWKTTEAVSLSAKSIPAVNLKEESVTKLFSLSKPDEVLPEVLTAGDDLYVFKLRTINKATVPATPKTDEEDQPSRSFGSSLMTAYEKSMRKNLEEKGRIWQNPEYLKIDQKKAPSEG